MAAKSKRLSTSVVIERVAALLDRADTELGLLTSAEALELVTEAHQVAGRVHALAARAAAHAEATAAADFEVRAPLASWLTVTTRMTRHEAKKLIGRGRDLAGFPALAAATASGEVLFEQAAAITGVLTKLPNDLSTQQVTEAEAIMIGFAAHHDSHELAHLAGHLLETIDPDTAEAREAKAIARQLRSARAARTLGFYSDGNGSVVIRGQLPTLAAEPLIKLVDAYAQQQRRTDAELTDPNAELLTNGMRRADALCALVAHHQQQAPAPSCGGDRPRIVVTMHYDTLLKACIAAGAINPDGTRRHGHGGGEPAPNAHQAPDGAPPLAHDVPRDGARPSAGATARRAGASADGDGGAPKARTNRGVPRGALLDAGTSISPGDLRRLACDADILPMILGGDSEILDVGRSQRLVTSSIRVALTLRDKGCVFPGCHTPATACHAHHLLPWWAGGSTSLENLALVCAHHHNLVEPARDGPPGSAKSSRRWRIEITNGKPKVLMPDHVPKSRRRT